MHDATSKRDRQVPNLNGQGPAKNQKQGKVVSGGSPSLGVRLNKEWRSVNPSDLLDAQVADQLEKECRKAKGGVIFLIDDLLDYPDRERLSVLDFIACLPQSKVAVDKARFDNLFDAVLSLIVGPDNMMLFTRA